MLGGLGEDGLSIDPTTGHNWPTDECVGEASCGEYFVTLCELGQGSRATPTPGPQSQNSSGDLVLLGGGGWRWMGPR